MSKTFLFLMIVLSLIWIRHVHEIQTIHSETLENQEEVNKKQGRLNDNIIELLDGFKK